MPSMKRLSLEISKTEVIAAYGGSPKAVAQALGITSQAVSAWKPILTERTAFRALAGLLLRAPAGVARAVRVLLFGGGSPKVQRAAAAFVKAVEQDEAGA
jgi:hypothetical protein